MAEAKKRSGGCMCGSIRYEYEGPIRDSVACYCKMCQRGTGNFVVASRIIRENLKIENDEALTWYVSSEWASRGFCKNCGSPLFFQSKDSEFISVKTGSLDDTSDLPIVYNIYVEAIDGHCLINEDLPSSVGYPKDDPSYPTI